MQSMNAYRQLKAFKFFYDGFVKNVWLYQCHVDSDLHLRVLYFRAYVHHSLSCDTPLEVYLAVKGKQLISVISVLCTMCSLFVG